jgi:hypothetical protein
LPLTTPLTDRTGDVLLSAKAPPGKAHHWAYFPTQRLYVDAYHVSTSSSGGIAKPSIVEARRMDRRRDQSRDAGTVATDSAFPATSNDDRRYLRDIDRKTRSSHRLHTQQVCGLGKIAGYCGMVLRSGIEFGACGPARASGIRGALSVDSLGRHLDLLFAIGSRKPALLTVTLSLRSKLTFR